MLGGRTTISGRAAAKIDVELPQPVRFSGEQISNADFEVTQGRGPFVGFLLLQQNPDDGNPVAVLGGRLSGGTTENPNKPVELLLAYNSGESLLEPDPIPAGDYSLYLITPGSPASVTIRFRGLAGSASFEPRTEANVVMKTLDENLAYPEGSPLYSAGSSASLRSNGIVFRSISMRSDAWVAGQYGYCTFTEDVQGVPAEVKYAPNCPTASNKVSGSFNDAFVTPERTRRVSYGAAFPLPEGNWNVSVWHTAAAAIRSSEAFAFWLSF